MIFLEHVMEEPVAALADILNFIGLDLLDADGLEVRT